VTFISPPGKAFTDEERGMPGVDVPGCVSSNSVKLRLVKGKSLSCRPISVELTVAALDWSMSRPPRTSTVSATAPSSSVTFSVAGTPGSSLISVDLAVLKPCADTVVS
jgi:hypothetical protein